MNSTVKFFFAVTTCMLLIATEIRSQQIAITFDDAPMGDGPLFTGDQRSIKIVDQLKLHGVQEAAFFVVTSYIDSSNIVRLQRYSNAGHILANHSHSHSWIRDIGTAKYIKDIQIADSILTGKLPYKKWYRYPYLDEGRRASSRDSIRQALTQLNLSNGYVTVDNYDWYLNGALRKAVDNGRKVNYSLLKQAYIDHIWNSIQFYDKLAKTVVNRSPKHVLLLHENDLAALFIGDLIKFLKAKGWKIISPTEAYSDPIANEIPDVLFNGQGRIAAIAYSKGMKPVELMQDAEDEDYLDQLLESMHVFVR